MTARTLIFCFDGTWNGLDDKYPTNVQRIWLGTKTPDQVPMYFAGPGNETENNRLMELLGGAFGAGSWAIVDYAIGTLNAVYQPGDRIAVVSFSRGAGNARMFANKAGMPITFLGCFDTVGAYLPFGMFQQGVFHDLHVSPAVEVAAHAVAIDEDRKAFTPNLMNARAGITEVWFPGVHCDVGGGIAETGHSDAALEWMLSQMAAVGIHANIKTHPNPRAPIGVNGGMYRREERRVGVQINDEWTDIKPVYFEGTP